MAVKTEITKILFRRGYDINRRELFTTYGGLDVGEPGFTAADRKTTSSLSAAGYTVLLGPDAAYHTHPDPAKAGLEIIRPVSLDTGNPHPRSGQPETGAPGADLWLGASQGEDIYIGGQSSEFYNQARFLPLSGTDWAWPNPYLQGTLVIGTTGGAIAKNNGHDTRFYGMNYEPMGFTSGTAISAQYMEWNSKCALLKLKSTSALQIPVGPTDARPGHPSNPLLSVCLSATGMIRYNTTQKSFEGLGAGDTWSSLGGARSKDGHTYITVEVPEAPDGCGQTATSDRAINANPLHPAAGLGATLGADDNITFITGCEYAGKFDGFGNLYIRNDIVAFHSSDKRQKDNIININTPLQKIYKLNGVEFDWNSNAPIWINETNNRHDVGIIAQDVQEVVPEAVTVRDNGYLAVDYKKLIPLLIEGIKELNDKVNSLESQLHSREK